MHEILLLCCLSELLINVCTYPKSLHQFNDFIWYIHNYLTLTRCFMLLQTFFRKLLLEMLPWERMNSCIHYEYTWKWKIQLLWMPNQKLLFPEKCVQYPRLFKASNYREAYKLYRLAGYIDWIMLYKSSQLPRIPF